MKKVLTLFTALIWLGSMSFVQADYYYRGNQNGWSATLMTPSTDGYYAYFSALGYSNNGNKNNEFKIALTADGWDYNCSIASAGFNSTDIDDMNNSSNSWGNESWNNAIYHSTDFYILVYYPNTTINSGSNPIMCASTFLPNNSVPSVPTVEAKGGWDEWADALAFTGDETSVSATKHLDAGDYEFKMIIGGGWRGNGYTYHRDFTGAEGIISNGDNMILEADVEGDYTFTWTYETNALSISFPTEPTPEYATVKFFAPRTEEHKWEHVYAFSWKKSRVFSDPWPGTEITGTKDAGWWYSYSARKGANLIFTDGAGMQTVDINDIQEAVCYAPTEISSPADPAEAKVVSVAVEADCTVEYYIAGSAALVGGTDDFDTNVALGEGNQITLDNVAAGQYKFKINNGTWAWALGGNDHLKSGDCSSIAETVGIGDVGFAIDHTQNITITYYPETQEICLGAETVLDPTLAWNTTFAAARKGMANTLPWLNHTLLAGVVYTSSNPSVASFADENAYELTLNAAGTTTITATYYGYSASYKLDVYDFAVPAKAVETVGGRFIINANNDSVIFSRGNLQYDFGAEQWYFAANQYDVLAEANLHFGDPNYKGVMDLFSWSNGNSNYGRIFSYLDADFTGNDFVDWGGLFTGGDYEWSTLSKDEWSYLMAHNNWTMIQLTPTPVATWEDGFLCLVLFPVEWEAPAELASLNYKFYDFDNDAKVAQNTFTMAQWKTLFEAKGAVLLPPAGARAGLYGSKISDGVHESTGPGLNPDAGGWYDHVDNVGWYGYYWLTDPHPTKNTQAYYVIFPGWSEGPTEADEDDIFIQPQVWNREKRRGNSVRLVERHPYIDPYVTVREGLTMDAYYTMCLEKAVTDVRGGSIWRVVSKAENGSDVLLEDVALPLDAGRPYIFYATADKLEVVYTGNAVGSPITEGNNGLIGSFVKAPIAQNPNNYIIYNNELYVVNSNNVYVGDHRAYLDMSAVPAYNGGSAPAPGRRRISMAVHGEQVATGIENDGLMNDGMMKVLIDGQLFLIRGEKMYDATGRLVK